jgi:hypothetical protein
MAVSGASGVAGVCATTLSAQLPTLASNASRSKRLSEKFPWPAKKHLFAKRYP